MSDHAGNQKGLKLFRTASLEDGVEIVRHWERGAVILFKRDFQTLIALFTRRVELCSLHSSPVADWRECRGVSLLPGWGFMLTFLSALWNDIKYPWYHSALLPVWYHQAGVLKLEIETCSKAPAPSSSAGEAAGCANSMSRSERFNYLILLSVPTPVSDFRVGRREFSACIQTDWRCDAVCERRVNLECAEVVGWIYQLLSRHLYQTVFSAFFCCFFC